MGSITKIAATAKIMNSAMWCLPYGATSSATSNGPNEPPRLPPTWKSDCANPRLPPEAKKVMRDASGCNTEEPMPTTKTEAKSQYRLVANDKFRIPASVKHIPNGNDQAMGRLSKISPIIGWNTEADIWYTNVIRPICAKLNDKSCLNRGYTAVITDWSKSFRQCEALSAINMGKAILRTGGLWVDVILIVIYWNRAQRYVKYSKDSPG